MDQRPILQLYAPPKDQIGIASRRSCRSWPFAAASFLIQSFYLCLFKPTPSYFGFSSGEAQASLLLSSPHPLLFDQKCTFFFSHDGRPHSLRVQSHTALRPWRGSSFEEFMARRVTLSFLHEIAWWLRQASLPGDPPPFVLAPGGRARFSYDAVAHAAVRLAPSGLRDHEGDRVQHRGFLGSTGRRSTHVDCPPVCSCCYE